MFLDLADIDCFLMVYLYLMINIVCILHSNRVWYFVFNVENVEGNILSFGGKYVTGLFVLVFIIVVLIMHKSPLILEQPNTPLFNSLFLLVT